VSVYSEVTLQDLRARLSGKLSDPSNVFWVESELDGYINESLSTWPVTSAEVS
jgi:hypothetical protein